MSAGEERELREELARLRLEHRQLDQEVTEALAAGTLDSIRAQRLKKRKLVLKDRIAVIEDLLLPDIIA